MLKRYFAALSCMGIGLVITACGQPVTTTPTQSSSHLDEEHLSPTGTLPVTHGPFQTPTPGIAHLYPPEIATAQAEERGRSGEVEPTSPPRATRTPAPTSTPNPALIPVIENVSFDVDLPYLQDGGALPSGALGRIGIGYIWYVSPVNDNADILLGTSTGIYTYQYGTFERTWRKYLTMHPWGMSASPDGTRVVSHYGWGADPIMFDTRDGSRVAVLNGWHEARWSPDGTKVAVEERPSGDVITTGADSFTGRINLYNGVTGELLRALEVEVPRFFGGVFSDIIWSPDSTRVAACGDNGIFIWNALNAELLHTISADSTSGGLYLRFCGIGFSPDGQYLAGADSSQRFIFDLSTGAMILDESGTFYQIGWSGNNVLFADNSGLTILDLTTLEEVNSVDIAVSDMMISPTRDRLAAVSGGDIVVMALPSFETQYRVPLAVDYVVWSPGGKWLVGYNYSDEAFILIDAVSGELWLPPLAPSGGLQFLDETTLFVVDDLNMFLLDMTTGAITSGNQYGVDVEQMGWPSDGKMLLFGSEEAMWVWREDTGEVRRVEAEESLLDTPEPIEKTVWVWEDDTGEVRRVVVEESPPDILEPIEIFDWRVDRVTSESPDGRLRATAVEDSACGDGPFGGFCGTLASEFTLMRIDQGTEEEILSFENNTGISAFGWSPDGSMLAIGEGGGENATANYEIIVIDTETGDELFRFEGHLGSINKLIFSPDGNRLASASSDGTVIIWNTAR